MIKILFICHGNICRSPMAEFIMKDLVEKAGLSQEIFVSSAAMTSEEIGYVPAGQEDADGNGRAFREEESPPHDEGGL